MGLVCWRQSGAIMEAAGTDAVGRNEERVVEGGRRAGELAFSLCIWSVLLAGMWRCGKYRR